jgi:hypothetical protein
MAPFFALGFDIQEITIRTDKVEAFDPATGCASGMRLLFNVGHGAYLAAAHDKSLKTFSTSYTYLVTGYV